MAMIPGGYILKARKALESDLMDKPPLWSKLWDWMLLRAEWRRNGKVTRGQFRTSIEEMREEMSWHVGYCKKKPSIKEIRKAYEGLTKGNMVSIKRGTRGMLVTVLNYDLYQEPKNYEGHDEGQYERSTKGKQGAHVSKEVKEAKNKKEILSLVEDRVDLRLARYLLNCIRKNLPEFKEPNLETWAKHMDLMLRVDKRDPDHMCKVITWVQEDNEPRGESGFCWASNILSPAKLREKYDMLTLKMAAGPGKRDGIAEWLAEQEEKEEAERKRSEHEVQQSASLSPPGPASENSLRHPRPAQ